MDSQGKLNIPALVRDLCKDFSGHDQGVVSDLLLRTYPLSPTDGFNLLLVAAAVAHARVTDCSRIASHRIGLNWRAQMHDSLAEFCNYVGFPSTIRHDDTSGDVVEVSPVPLPVRIPPTPTPPPPSELVDEAMAEDDDPGTPLASVGPLPTPAPPPVAPVSAISEPRAPITVSSTAARQAGPKPPRGKPGPLAGESVTGGKGKAKAAPTPPKQKPTYAAAAQAAAAPATPPTPAPPPRASVVISLPDASRATSLAIQSQMCADLVALLCSQALAAQPVYANVKVSAARWTPKGNLVVFGGPDTSQDALLSASHVLTSAISQRLPLPGPSRMSARANVKWSKILVNGVPLRSAPTSELGVTPSAVLHAQLTKHNPSYAALKITQMPSWVRAPSTYLPSAVTSSLVVAFEDPDGSIARTLIKAKCLFAFGTQAVVRKWKYKAPHPNTRLIRMADAQIAASVAAGTTVLSGTARPGSQAQRPKPPTNVLSAAMAVQSAWEATRGDSSTPVATAGPSNLPPMPAGPSAPLVYSPPTAPPGRKTKRAKKKASFASAIAWD